MNEISFISATRKIALRVPKDDWFVIALSFIAKVLVIGLGLISFHINFNVALPTHQGWLQIWNRSDSVNYLLLASGGYGAAGAWKSSFYPLFPWSVRIVHFVTRDYLVAGFVVSAISLAAAVVLLRRLLCLDFSREIALRAVWFLLIFPTAYFLHIAYAESMFLALAVGSIFAGRSNKWWIAGGLGALAWMTHANGVVLVPTLVVEAALQFWKTRRWNWQWLWICAVPLGFGVYLLLKWHATGHPVASPRAATTLPVTSWPWAGIRNTFQNLHRTASQAEMSGAQELYFSLLGLLCVIASWIKLRSTYAVWATGCWLLLDSVTVIKSAPRYALLMFPLFILFALASEKRFWGGLITVWSLLFLALFTAVFVRGAWAF